MKNVKFMMKWLQLCIISKELEELWCVNEFDGVL